MGWKVHLQAGQTQLCLQFVYLVHLLLPKCCGNSQKKNSQDIQRQTTCLFFARSPFLFGTVCVTAQEYQSAGNEALNRLHECP